MKILHTADWHLGKKLDRFSRIDEQVLVLEEIVNIADQENVDLVLVAGDLFDSFNPTTEAAELFYKTLKKLAKNGERPVIAISGNHDSPALIDAPNPLARACGIVLIGHPNAKIEPLELPHFKITQSSEGFLELKLEKFEFPIRILHTAFANEIRMKQYFGEEKEQQLNLLLKDQWQKTADQFCDENGINFLVTHLYMNQRGTPLLDEPDGEKPLKIGNADLIFSDAIPSQIQYTALGHLHGYKNIGSQEKPIIYASSPLCYSFSEAGQTKSVTIIEAKPKENVSIKKIELKNGKPLYRKTFDQIDEAVSWLENHPHSWVELTVISENFLKNDDRKRLLSAHAGIVYLIPKILNDPTLETCASDINLSADASVLFQDYFKSKYAGQQPNEELMQLFHEISNHQTGAKL